MITLQLVISIAAIVSAGMTILGHYLHPPRLLVIGIFKPLTTILIMILALLPGAFPGETYARLIVIGLFFSLLGDVFLVLPSDQFLLGLGAFLVGLVCYAFAFRTGQAAPGFPWGLLLLSGVALAIVRYLWSGLSRSLRAPVVIYVGAITVMAALAVGNVMLSYSFAALLAGTGAVLFMASDATLAINRFRKPFRLSPAVVLATYFAAQLLIALSVSAHA